MRIQVLEAIDTFRTPHEYPNVIELYQKWTALHEAQQAHRRRTEQHERIHGGFQPEDPTETWLALNARTNALSADAGKAKAALDAAIAHRSEEILKAEQPAHRAAVRRMARSYVALSVAVTAEEAMHRDVQGRKVRRSPGLMPLIGVQGVGDWASPMSPVNRWLEEVRRLGFITEDDIGTWAAEAILAADA